MFFSKTWGFVGWLADVVGSVAMHLPAQVLQGGYCCPLFGLLPVDTFCFHSYLEAGMLGEEQAVLATSISLFKSRVHQVLFGFSLVTNIDCPSTQLFSMYCFLMQVKKWKEALTIESVTFPMTFFSGLTLSLLWFLANRFFCLGNTKAEAMRKGQGGIFPNCNTLASLSLS